MKKIEYAEPVLEILEMMNDIITWSEMGDEKEDTKIDGGSWEDMFGSGN